MIDWIPFRNDNLRGINSQVWDFKQLFYSQPTPSSREFKDPAIRPIIKKEYFCTTN